MSIVNGLFRIWAAITMLAFAVDIACFWLANHTPAAQTASEATVYLDTFLISASAPILVVPVLAVAGLLWGLLRALLGLARHWRAEARLNASRPRSSSARHARA